jgi:hypothetical protein
MTHCDNSACLVKPRIGEAGSVRSGTAGLRRVVWEGRKASQRGASITRELSVMAGVPVKFRCYRCNTLLGVSRSKIGSVIACVKCGTELVVPDPDEAPPPDASAPASSPSNLAEPSPSFLSALEAGVPLALQEIHPEDIRIEPGVSWTPVDTSPAPVGPTTTIAPPEPEPAPAPKPEPAPPHPEPVPAPRVSVVPEPPRTAAAPEPAVPTIEVEPVKITRERSTPGRPRDLTIPRSVVAFWSLFVLIAQALGFVAGLLAGHYLWRVH